MDEVDVVLDILESLVDTESKEHTGFRDSEIDGELLDMIEQVLKKVCREVDIKWHDTIEDDFHQYRIDLIGKEYKVTCDGRKYRVKIVYLAKGVIDDVEPI
jgi:hypothetical protein